MNKKDQQLDNQDKEKNLLEIIGKFKKSIDHFNKNKRQNMSVVLIVGLTGSGKSTIFNFLSGADFIFNNNKQLELKNPSYLFSKMIGGMKSITKELNFYHNQQNNHLIIDFPGFQDTNGEWDQLLFELLFNKVVTSGPIKVIYVIKNTESSLPNRGSDLQEFIKQLCLKGNINIQKFNLLLNCYMEDLSDEQLKNQIKEDLKSVNILQSIDKIIVLRKAKKDDELQQIFSNQQRQFFWQQIQQMQFIKIQPQKLPKSEIISEYLRYTTLKTIEKYGIVLCEVFDNSLQKLSDSQRQMTLTQMQQLLDLINRENKESPLQWYINYISICEQLLKGFQVKYDIVTYSNNFKEIFTYFSQFSELIKGYDEMTIIKSIAEDQLKKVKNIISQRLEQLKMAQQNKAKMQEIEREKQQLQQIIINYQQSIKQLTNRLEEIEKQHNQEIKDLHKKLDLDKQQQRIVEEKNQKLLIQQNELMQQKLEKLQADLGEKEKKQKETVNNQQETIEYLNRRINRLQNSSSSSGCKLI